MSMKQLDTLLKYELDKEQKAITQLKQAESDYQDNVSRLQNVGEFRLEYMKRLNDRSLKGVDSSTYRHFHAFVSKLDNAAEQVRIAINQAKALVDQRKKQWLAQRQKVKAVEMLREKKQLALAKIAAKQEQNMFDEIATQQFIRAKSVY